MELKWRLSSKAVDRIVPTDNKATATVVLITLPSTYCRAVCRQQGWTTCGQGTYRHPVTNVIMADVYRNHTYFYSR